MVQIPALWTGMTNEQESAARIYIRSVFLAAEGAMGGGGYFMKLCTSDTLRCDWCRCPIGRNHSYLSPSYQLDVYGLICFDCAEEEFFLPGQREADEDPDPFALEPLFVSCPEFLMPFREVKFK
jgi:hypothetical protein